MAEEPSHPPFDAKRWPAAKIAQRRIDALVPYARNARKHTDAQVEQIANSIREWGWTVPVLIDETGGIIAGHGRVLAAKKLGIVKVPVMIAKGWSEAQKRAYVLADNKLALNGTWDDQLLAGELGELRALDDTDLSLIGFSEKELAKLLGDIIPVTAPQLEGMAYAIIVRCKDETHQRELLAQLESQGLTCDALIS